MECKQSTEASVCKEQFTDIGQDVFIIPSCHDLRGHTTANLGDFTFFECDGMDPLRHLEWVVGERSTEDPSVSGESSRLQQDIHSDGGYSITRQDIEQLWTRHLERSVCADQSDTPRRDSPGQSDSTKDGEDATNKRVRLRERTQTDNERPASIPPASEETLRRNSKQWLDQQWLNLAMDNLRVLGRKYDWTAEENTVIYELIANLWHRTSPIREPAFNQFFMYAIISIACKYWCDNAKSAYFHSLGSFLPPGFSSEYLQQTKAAELSVLRFINFQLYADDCNPMLV